MSKNLSRLTWRAQKDANQDKPREDRRKLPACGEPLAGGEACKRKVDTYPDGTPTAHCYWHRTAEEWQAYKAAWQAWRESRGEG